MGQLDILTALQALAGVLIVVVSGLGAAALLTSRSIRIEEEKRSFYAASEERLRSGLKARAAKMFEGSGITLTASEIVNLWVGAVVTVPLLALALGAQVPVALALAGATALLPILWLRGTEKRNRTKFGDDLGQVLPLVASNLKGGLSLRQAITPVGNNMDEPIKGEFARLARDIDRGMPIEVALVHMGERNENNDVMLLASAVSAQRETGGNLADIVETVANTVRTRTMIRRDIRSKTSQARATAKILAAMPVVMLVVLCLMNEVYRDFYSQPGGWAVIAVGAALELIGYVMLRKMADIQAD